MVEGEEDLYEKECLIRGRVDFIDKSGAIYVNGRGIQHIIREGNYIIVYKLQKKNSSGMDKK